MYHFSKQRMIDRLTAEGRANQITPDVVAIMDNLDGCVAIASCWARVVQGRPVLWCVGKDGEGELVNEFDCI